MPVAGCRFVSAGVHFGQSGPLGNGTDNRQPPYTIRSRKLCDAERLARTVEPSRIVTTSLRSCGSIEAT